jgi:hypothetical protein
MSSRVHVDAHGAWVKEAGRQIRSAAALTWVLAWAIPFVAAAPACDGTLAPGGSFAQVACPAPDHPPVPICGAALCGNGMIDNCQICEVGPLSASGTDLGAPNSTACSGSANYSVSVDESCDGSDLGTATCASLGFGGGTLACSDRCTFQTNGCTTCLADTGIVACRNAEVDAAAPGALAIAATDSEVVIAWVPGPGLRGTLDADAGSVRLARFDSGLSLIAQSGCLGPAHARHVAIARTRSGYVLAIEGDGGVTVQALDPTLQPSGALRVVPDAGGPSLTARQSGTAVLGGPLLTWTASLPPSGTSHQAEGELLDDGGGEETVPATIFGDESFIYNAVFTGDAFLVTSDDRHDFIARFALDGTVTIPENTAIPAGVYSEYAQIVWTGEQGAVIFQENPGLFWAPVDASGAISGPPVAMDETVYPRVSLAHGSEMWIVGSEGTGGANLALTRISSTGNQIAPPLDVVSDPEIPFLPVVAGLGPNTMVLGWVGGMISYPGRIGLALLSP